MFLDQAVITVQGGAGGRGCVSWRREKFEPNGGPNGGDGGRGGDVILLADANTDTLSNYASKKRFEAQKGMYGSGKNMHGKDGEDTVLLVPPGTQITDVAADGSRTVLADLTHHGDRVLVAAGGRGGYGNAHFATSTRQRPDFAELGEPGEKRTLALELKLVADVGIIGYPSVGKSTLISVISAAKPKIADYPFTTLVPNLGVVTVDDRSYVVCDVPGLIEGASEGKGLGDAFLKHIERCRILLHVLDISRCLEDGKPSAALLRKDYDAIRKELTAYSPTLAAKTERIALNKADLIPHELDTLLADIAEDGLEIFAVISAATRGGTDELKKKLLPLVLSEKESAVEAEIQAAEDAPIPVLRPHLSSPKMGAYRIEARDDAIIVTGKRLEQFTTMTDFSNRGGVDRFRDVVERIGLMRALKPLRKSDDVPVFIGKTRVDEYL